VLPIGVQFLSWLPFSCTDFFFEPTLQYKVIDLDGDGYGSVPVDGMGSHTHGPGETLNAFKWREGANVLANNAISSLQLPVGNHKVTLQVTDTDGNVGEDLVDVDVMPYGYPAVLAIEPNSGSISGGQQVTITGSGFNFTEGETIVHFGEGLARVSLTGADVQVTSFTTLEVLTPATVVGGPVSISVQTPKAESNTDIKYTYIAGVPLEFQTGILAQFDAPTIVSSGFHSLYVCIS